MERIATRPGLASSERAVAMWYAARFQAATTSLIPDMRKPSADAEGRWCRKFG